MPLLQTTLKSMLEPSILVISKSEMVIVLDLISTVSPARANSYKRFPSFFIAENIGGNC